MLGAHGLVFVSLSLPPTSMDMRILPDEKSERRRDENVTRHVGACDGSSFADRCPFTLCITPPVSGPEYASLSVGVPVEDLCVSVSSEGNGPERGGGRGGRSDEKEGWEGLGGHVVTYVCVCVFTCTYNYPPFT